jgi:septal ring factor EnvC (AmiA/AmiB activator)
MRAATKIAGTDDVASAPILYIELRKGGRPIDPTPWLKPAG